ncbi:hypothetical protein GKZ28_04010 [Clostridium chromiireducens]|uniref:Uncharacterized protein n=1 Tax=Clostridium chromiireducens TaxID=225345 RepID=A0A964RJT2_9CLOT|nr:hypothetical protein [Clostridium chromiireducens]
MIILIMMLLSVIGYCLKNAYYNRQIVSPKYEVKVETSENELNFKKGGW